MEVLKKLALPDGQAESLSFKKRNKALESDEKTFAWKDSELQRKILLELKIIIKIIFFFQATLIEVHHMEVADL